MRHPKQKLEYLSTLPLSSWVLDIYNTMQKAQKRSFHVTEITRMVLANCPCRRNVETFLANA